VVIYSLYQTVFVNATTLVVGGHRRAAVDQRSVVLLQHAAQQFGGVRMGIEPFVVALLDAGFVGFHQLWLDNFQGWDGVGEVLRHDFGVSVVQIIEAEAFGYKIRKCGGHWIVFIGLYTLKF